MRTTYTILILIILILIGVNIFKRDTIELPRGETVPLSEVTLTDNTEPQQEEVSIGNTSRTTNNPTNTGPTTRTATREILLTDGTRHSIPLNEILSGGPGKDGIPSIDDPTFITATEALETYSEDTVGLGLQYNGATRFYPYSVLVWHEIVNDDIGSKPVTVTYCPLCMTGIVFEPTLDGREFEFGVSGMLWQSNLLMYNRTNGDDESLWSQVLGEAVLGPHTGKKLTVLPADTVKMAEWIKMHPDTEVLSKDTGAIRNYGRDPYGDYYTNESVSFGASFNDTRLHPKAFVLGIEINGVFKAYEKDALPIGTTHDTVDGVALSIVKNETGQVLITADNLDIPHIDGFWFSWLAVHPDTLLWNANN